MALWAQTWGKAHKLGELQGVELSMG